MAWPEGQYFCNDRGKCMPIPKGHKVRKDGELVKEVAPPGWGPTKAEKEKTDPSKPKSKIGGSAAAFDRARKEGRFKGSKEDMFKLMWYMKNKGGKPKGKPHYKPGTDEKYKKYQNDESFEIDPKKHKKARRDAKIGNLARNTTNVGEREAAERKQKGPKLMGEQQVNLEGFLKKAADAMKKVATKKKPKKLEYGRDAGAEAAERLRKKDHETVNFLDPDD